MLLTLVLFLGAACSPRINDSAVCAGIARFVDAHNEALLEDGGDKAVISGASLIAAIDASCAI